MSNRLIFNLDKEHLLYPYCLKFWGRNKPVNIPIMEKPSIIKQSIYFSLSIDYHEWFVDNEVNYSLEEIDNESCIIFSKKADMMFFKLTWG